MSKKSKFEGLSAAEIVRNAATACLAEVSKRAKKGDDIRTLAAERFEAVVRSEPAVMKALVEDLLPQICHRTISDLIRSANGVSWNQQEADQHAKRQTQRLHALAEYTLMNTVLPNGVLLRDAKATDVRDAAEHFHAKGKTLLHKSQWLLMVEMQLKPGKTVGQCLSEDDLRDLQKKAVDTNL